MFRIFLPLLAAISLSFQEAEAGRSRKKITQAYSDASSDEDYLPEGRFVHPPPRNPDPLVPSSDLMQPHDARHFSNVETAASQYTETRNAPLGPRSDFKKQQLDKLPSISLQAVLDLDRADEQRELMVPLSLLGSGVPSTYGTQKVDNDMEWSEDVDIKTSRKPLKKRFRGENSQARDPVVKAAKPSQNQESAQNTQSQSQFVGGKRRRVASLDDEYESDGHADVEYSTSSSNIVRSSVDSGKDDDSQVDDGLEEDVDNANDRFEAWVATNAPNGQLDQLPKRDFEKLVEKPVPVYQYGQQSMVDFEDKVVDYCTDIQIATSWAARQGHQILLSQNKNCTVWNSRIDFHATISGSQRCQLADQDRYQLISMGVWRVSTHCLAAMETDNQNHKIKSTLLQGLTITGLLLEIPNDIFTNPERMQKSSILSHIHAGRTKIKLLHKCHQVKGITSSSVGPFNPCRLMIESDDAQDQLQKNTRDFEMRKANFAQIRRHAGLTPVAGKIDNVRWLCDTVEIEINPGSCRITKDTFKNTGTAQTIFDRSLNVEFRIKYVPLKLREKLAMTQFMKNLESVMLSYYGALRRKPTKWIIDGDHFKLRSEIEARRSYGQRGVAAYAIMTAAQVVFNKYGGMLNLILPADADATLFAPELAVGNFSVRLNGEIGLIVQTLADVDATLAAAARADDLTSLLITVLPDAQNRTSWHQSESVIRHILSHLKLTAVLKSIRFVVVLSNRIFANLGKGLPHRFETYMRQQSELLAPIKISIGMRATSDGLLEIKKDVWPTLLDKHIELGFVKGQAKHLQNQS